MCDSASPRPGAGRPALVRPQVLDLTPGSAVHDLVAAGGAKQPRQVVMAIHDRLGVASTSQDGREGCVHFGGPYRVPTSVCWTIETLDVALPAVEVVIRLDAKRAGLPVFSRRLRFACANVAQAGTCQASIESRAVAGGVVVDQNPSVVDISRCMGRGEEPTCLRIAFTVTPRRRATW